MLQYASLDEAWQASPAIRKKKKVKSEKPGHGMVDEAIQRYPLLSPDSALPWTDNDNDVSFPASAYASNKAVVDEYKPFPDYSAAIVDAAQQDFARTDAPLTGLDGPTRRTPEVVHVAESQQNSGAAREISVESRPNQRETDNVFDVVLYVFSGIVLILLLEQFVQMGVQLRR